MKAILLAAGIGTRLRPLTNTVPKCLVPIQGKPLMKYWFELLDGSEISEVLVNTHYLAEDVQQFIRKDPFAANVTVTYESELLGTGGTVIRNLDFVQEESVLLAHADNLTLFNVTDFITQHGHRPKHCEITMMTFTTPTPESCGIVELDASGVVVNFFEKVKNPPGNLANAAVYIIEPAVVRFMQNLNKTMIDFSTEVLPHFIGRIFSFHNSMYHRDIGTMESWEQANQDMAHIGSENMFHSGVNFGRA